MHDFPVLLDEYDDQLPFDRSGQYELHRRTIDERRRLGSVAAALEDRGFARTLRRTLEAWGIGKRASLLAPLPEFVAELRR